MAAPQRQQILEINQSPHIARNSQSSAGWTLLSSAVNISWPALLNTSIEKIFLGCMLLYIVLLLHYIYLKNLNKRYEHLQLFIDVFLNHVSTLFPNVYFH